MKTKAAIAGSMVVAAMLAVGASARADEMTNPTEPPKPGIVDNLYIIGSAGWEKPPGEDSTGFASIGANWGIPLTPPADIAVGLQLGGNVTFRDDDPEGNVTFGGFARNFRVFGNQQAAIAALFDYRRTAFHNDVWDFRPIIGTTVSPQDGLGLEFVAPLNTDRGQQAIGEFTGFWTRDWIERFSTELGLGYQFSGVDEGLLRARLAFGLNPQVDVGVGGDLNTDGNYAMGVVVSFHLGYTGRHAFLHNIGGYGAQLYTPFPDASFPELLHRSR